jgi:hypothetical protein
VDISLTGSVTGEAEAFLIVQRGAARLEVVPMAPSARVSVGRAASNRLVLADPKCSRQHCEFIHRDGRWYVRDLDSRNGLTVDGRRIVEEHALSIGETVGIGACSLLYTDHEPQDPAAAAATVRSGPYAVIERKTGTKFDPPRSGEIALPQGRHGVSELFRLAQAMTAAADIPALTDCVLAGLLGGTGAEIGAVLLLPADAANDACEFLEPVSVRGPAGVQFSTYLSELVLQDREAVLVHDIPGHEVLSASQTLSGLSPQSAICAPIRTAGATLGVIHLYSANAANSLDAEHLEFTLAVDGRSPDQSPRPATDAGRHFPVRGSQPRAPAAARN